MNIIELFENAAIYRENLSEFNFDDTIKVQKQFEIERSQNPAINPNLATNLILAINDFPNELLFISSNRILYNFFSKKNHSRSRFISDVNIKTTPEAIQRFITTFLNEELDLFFEQKMAQNKFDELEDILVVKEYFPEMTMKSLAQKVAAKCDFVLEKVEKNPSLEDSISFNFIKHRSFYDLLSHFRSPEIDQKIKALLNILTSTLVSFNIKTEFLNSVMISMANYKAVDVDLANLLKSNKDQTIVNTEKMSSSSGSGMSTWSTIVVVILVIRLVLLMIRCNR